MTVDMRAYADGTLRGLPYAYGSTEGLIVAMSGDCGCCEVYDDTPIPTHVQGLVDTGEKATVTASGSAYFPGFWYQDFAAIRPSAAFNAGGVASATVSLFRPGTINMTGIPGTWDVDGSGFNNKYIVNCEFGFAGVTTSEYYQHATDPTPPGTVTFSASYPVRLFADIKEYGRFNDNGTIWGPRPASASDGMDLRGYKTASLNWYYWGKDGAGSMSVTAFGASFSTSGSADSAPMAVTAGGAELRAASLQEMVGSAWLEFQHFGSPAFPDYYGEVWDIPEPSDNSAGVKAWTSGRRCYIEALGDIPSARNGQIVFANIQPDRRLQITAAAVDGNGKAWAANTFAVPPLDGPTISTGTVPVNTEFPIGTALDLMTPGSLDRTGTAHTVQAFCWLGLDTNTSVISEAVDTIGTPAFGFVLDTTDLAAAGASGDQWRFPIRIPAARASWQAVICRLKIPIYPASVWTAGAGTTVTLSGTESHVTGAGTLTVTQVLGADWSIPTARWLAVRFKGAGTLSIGSKQWPIDTSGAWMDIIIDLCAPGNASGYDRTTTKIEAGASAGWAWGVEGTPTVTITAASEFWIDTFVLLHRAFPGLLNVREAVIASDSRFLSDTVTEGIDEISVYDHRGLLWAPDGRIAVDAEMGTVGNGYSSGQPQRVRANHSIAEMVRLANLDIAGEGAFVLENIRPPHLQLFTGWGGAFSWYDWSRFWTGGVEAFHLKPTIDYPTGGVTLYADYCVDRIVPGVGVSGALTNSLIIGPAIHGLTVGAAGGAAPMGVNANADRAVSGAATGLFTLPQTEQFTHGDSYAVTPDSGAFEGPPSVTATDGISERVGVIKA